YVARAFFVTLARLSSQTDRKNTRKPDRLKSRLTPKFSGGAPTSVTWHFIYSRPLQLLVRRQTRTRAPPIDTSDFSETKRPFSCSAPARIRRISTQSQRWNRRTQGAP